MHLTDVIDLLNGKQTICQNFFAYLSNVNYLSDQFIDISTNQA